MQENIIDITGLDIEARGVGHVPNADGSPGKVIFVEGALPGERVCYSTFKKKKNWEMANMQALLRESPQRVKPACPHFGMCGGCAMQHLEPTTQVAIKQRVLEDNLWHIGKVKAENILRPIYGPSWGYRYRARLSVRHVKKKGQVLVGFHERKSAFVADIKECLILPPHVSAMLLPLRELISSLSIIEQVPQIELAVGANVTALVLRIMAALSLEDEEKLRAFADQYQVQWWLQTKGPETAQPYYPLNLQLDYRLPEFGITMPFKPVDFTQVNHLINQVLVSRAMRLLDVRPGERVADLFCGLGNFTLPIATLAARVVGIEGSTSLTQRALENAQLNGLADKTEFSTRNLFEMTVPEWLALGRFDRMLIDPPRDGAQSICQTLASLAPEQAQFKPQRIVYVSCSPSTLARDASILVHEAGYQLRFAGIMNMFPHTSHVESMAVFERGPII
jgi:23S rRNA (uracil1939-C5)-methyltransferase